MNKDVGEAMEKCLSESREITGDDLIAAFEIIKTKVKEGIVLFAQRLSETLLSSQMQECYRNLGYEIVPIGKRPNKIIDVEDTEDGIRICRGSHAHGIDCQWEHYTLKSNQDATLYVGKGDQETTVTVNGPMAEELRNYLAKQFKTNP